MAEHMRLKIVTEVINAWDPIGLLSGGAPLNEYQPEIIEICKRRIEAMTEVELAVFIQEVFVQFVGIKPAALPALIAAMKISHRIKMS